jgi:hypothetical protein
MIPSLAGAAKGLGTAPPLFASNSFLRIGVALFRPLSATT